MYILIFALPPKSYGPQAGRSRLEPVGVIICSALMGMASLEVIKDSISTFVDANQVQLCIVYILDLPAGIRILSLFFLGGG